MNPEDRNDHNSEIEHGLEAFALYGFEAQIRDDWRVEVNPKAKRKKGDVVFHTPLGNRLFVSWGPLEDASRRFKTLEEHRDWNVEQIKKSPNLKEFDVSDKREYLINGHRALSAHVKASLKQGFGGRGTLVEDIWSVRFYCPNLSRYYVIYSQQRDAHEFKDFGQVFNSIVGGFRCHT